MKKLNLILLIAFTLMLTACSQDYSTTETESEQALLELNTQPMIDGAGYCKDIPCGEICPDTGDYIPCPTDGAIQNELIRVDLIDYKVYYLLAKTDLNGNRVYRYQLIKTFNENTPQSELKDLLELTDRLNADWTIKDIDNPNCTLFNIRTGDKLPCPNPSELNNDQPEAYTLCEGTNFIVECNLLTCWYESEGLGTVYFPGHLMAEGYCLLHGIILD